MTSSSPEPELVDIDATTTAVIRGVVAMTELPNFFDRSFSTLAEVIAGQGIEITGPAFALYRRVSGGKADLEVGFPTARAVEPSDPVVASSLPAGRAARLTHAGGYDQLGASWERLQQWITAQGLTPTPTFWEIYVTEPSPDMDPADLRTDLVWPVA